MTMKAWWWGDDNAEAEAEARFAPFSEDTAQRCFLGVDGGGTKTACLVAQETGHVLGAGLGGPINLNFVSEEMACESLAQAVGSAWRGAGPPTSIPAVAVISGPIPLAIARKNITRETGTERVIHVGEGEAAWQAASPWLNFDCGVAVDAGTGSLAVGFTREGERAAAGGWGATLGDEGSGYWISIQAMRAAVRAEDGREPPTRLREAICQALEIEDLRELIPLIYQKGMARHEVAALCPVVAQVARQGDARAQTILAEAGKELALLVEVVIHRLGMDDEEFAVIPFGSVFRVGELILAPFRGAVMKKAPRAKIIAPRYEPVVGALLIAMQEEGIRPDDQLLATLEEGLRDDPVALGWKSDTGS